MAKPFKSEFDLMAEAYGTINRSKQAVINEHTSARSVIGYPPQVVEEGDKPKIDYGPSGEGKEVHPDEAAESTILDMDVYTQEQEEPIRVRSSSESEVEAEFAAKGLTVTQILYPEPGFSDGSDSPDNEQYPEPGVEDAETGNGWSDIKSVELGGKVYELGIDDPNDDGLVIEIEKYRNGYFITGGVYSEPEDYVRDPNNSKEGYGYALTLDGQPMDEDDLWDRDTDHDLRTPDSKMQLDDRGNKVHPDEDAENPAHVRLDGMVHQELFSQLQKALTAVVADLHSNDEMFEVGDVLDYLGSTMKGVEY